MHKPIHPRAGLLACLAVVCLAAARPADAPATPGPDARDSPGPLGLADL